MYLFVRVYLHLYVCVCACVCVSECFVLTNTIETLVLPANEITLQRDTCTGISMTKYYNFTKFCYLCNSNKSHTNQDVIIQQPLITTICATTLLALQTLKMN